MPTEEPKQSEKLGKVTIRRVSLDDLPKAWEIIGSCARALADQGMTHWTDHYSIEMVQKLIVHKEVYLAEQDGKHIGTLTFDDRPPNYYQEEEYDKKFQEPGAPAGYVMAMGVLPEYQGMGIAGKMLAFAESISKERGLRWLRLDCRNEVPGLVRFYENRGFEKVGDAPLQEGENESYWLMEKLLDEVDPRSPLDA